MLERMVGPYQRPLPYGFEILHCRALKKFEGSIAARDERLNKDILRTMDLTSGDREEDSDAH